MGTKRAMSAGNGVLAAATGDAPTGPGVYLFLDDIEDVIYVGKATSLRSRLRQHAGVGPPTSHLHERYERVRRVAWAVTETEREAAWWEADLIFALRPRFNADPGLRSRGPIGGAEPVPFLVLSEVDESVLRFALESEPSTASASVYGCFPHLGKGVSSQLGIACSDGYVALLRVLWAASGEGTRVPTAITRSAPGSFEVTVAPELRGGLHRLLSGVSPKVIDQLTAEAGMRPAFMQPALRRDREACAQFFAAGPHRVRALRLRHGHKETPVTAETFRRWVIDEVTSAAL